KQFSAVRWVKEQREKGNKKRLDALNQKGARRAKTFKQLERVKDLIGYYLGTDCLAWRVAAWATGQLSDQAIENTIRREQQANGRAAVLPGRKRPVPDRDDAADPLGISVNLA